MCKSRSSFSFHFFQLQIFLCSPFKGRDRVTNTHIQSKWHNYGFEFSDLQSFKMVNSLTNNNHFQNVFFS